MESTTASSHLPLQARGRRSAPTARTPPPSGTRLPRPLSPRPPQGQALQVPEQQTIPWVGRIGKTGAASGSAFAVGEKSKTKNLNGRQNTTGMKTIHDTPLTSAGCRPNTAPPSICYFSNSRSQVRCVKREIRRCCGAFVISFVSAGDVDRSEH